jgi:hypothetical protein
MSAIAMKQPNTISGDGQNWQWPQKTWFRERLSAIKAQENQQRRRPIVRSQQPATVASSQADATDPMKAE